VNEHYRGVDPAQFALHDAQLVLARAYGFESWPKLKARVDGVTVTRLHDAVERGDLDMVRDMLHRRSEIVNRDREGYGERLALHLAVLRRDAPMTRLLMENGADARAGIWPYRKDTQVLTMATERGDDEIVAIIREEEERRRTTSSGSAAIPPDLQEACRSDDEERVMTLLEADPRLLHASFPSGRTLLHAAAAMLNERMVGGLLERGADVNRRDLAGNTPLDLAASQECDRHQHTPDRFAVVAGMLRGRGAELSAASAVALGEADSIRARHAEGMLVNPSHGEGLLTLAVRHDQPEILALLLDLGFDPDERMREDGEEEAVYSWGQPLQECAASGKLAMAEMLLSGGADANAWACVWNAYRQRDEAMIQLLARYGGVPNAATPGYLRDTPLAARMFADEAAGTLPKATVRPGKTVAEEVLDPAASAGATEILRMALERIYWPRDDPRWFGILASPLCFWNHIPWIYSKKWDLDRSTYLPCFRMVLERCHANVCGRFGMTILHYASASYDWITPRERVAFLEELLAAGAELGARDELLKSTPLGWACRWGRVEVVKLLLDRGADPVEPEAEPWTTPLAWAQKMRRGDVLAVLREFGR
jgi:ankyrin repeat protein